jgi:hypothetical protein
MCNHLGISLDQTSNTLGAVMNSFSTGVRDHPEHTASTDKPSEPHPLEMEAPQYGIGLNAASLEPPLHWLEDSTVIETMMGDSMHDLYSLYNEDALSFSGRVETDWEALEREISLPQ